MKLRKESKWSVLMLDQRHFSIRDPSHNRRLPPPLGGIEVSREIVCKLGILDMGKVGTDVLVVEEKMDDFCEISPLHHGSMSMVMDRLD